jgi:exodeoxyribonuclease VII large subunit
MDPRPLTVTELAGRIKRLLEDQVGTVTVSGEVSNLRIPSSGHCYFLLKDAGAAINAVCFRGTLGRQRVRPADGMQLELTGRVSAYAARSEYQLVVDSMREAGLGDLMRRFLELKERLKTEGLFDQERKRPIPQLPRCLGLVTSCTGAALRDMLNILGRRARGLTIYLAPCAVQGDAAPAEIVNALQLLQRDARAEVIIVGRGGGSIEDLWAFNDERVARAIATSRIPVISAVGHETDTTLADYAADLRAPTPSAAAELVSAHHGEVAAQLRQWQQRLGRIMRQHLAERRARLERCRNSWGLRSPRERVQAAMQRLDDLQVALQQAMQHRLARSRERSQLAAAHLQRTSPLTRLRLLQARLAYAQDRLRTQGPVRWLPQLAAAAETHRQLAARLQRAVLALATQRRLAVSSLSDRLAGLNPESVLQRGYSIVTHGRNGKVIKSPAQVRPDDLVRIRSAGGQWRALVLPGESDLFDPQP